MRRVELVPEPQSKSEAGPQEDDQPVQYEHGRLRASADPHRDLAVSRATAATDEPGLLCRQC